MLLAGTVVLLAITLGVSQQNPEGHCWSYGQCDQDEITGKLLSCYDTNAARPLQQEAEETFRELCPNLYNHQGTSYTCCDSSQIEDLKADLALPAILLSRCPGCWNNFRDLLCHLLCSSNQSLFLQPTELKPYSHGQHSLTAVTYYVSKHFAEGLFRSCRNVTAEALGMKALALICGEWGYDNCTAERLLEFLGDRDNGQTPLSMTPIIVDAPGIVVNSTTFYPINSTVIECYEPVPGSNSNATCGCENCEEECIAKEEN